MLQRGPKASCSDETSSDLLYARGFLLCRRENAPRSVLRWTAREVGSWTLYVDSRVPVGHAEVGDREAWVVGDAFHPGQSVFTEIARRVLEEDLLQALDGLAGRFVLIYRNGSRLEIYHDAMGSRSVFYGEEVVASHAALAAEVLGSGLRAWIIPFITSRGYLRRDVKYLPGLDSPFEGIAQLTPNTRILFPYGQVERYWPRQPVVLTDPEQALESLIRHLEGLRKYLQANRHEPILGVSAGRDSRGLLAALAPLEPRLFTFVRSAGAQSEDSADSRAARRLAAELGLDLEIVKIPAPPHLDSASSPFAITFRQNTGYVRGNNSGWVEHYAGLGLSDHIFVRGFGGEVMRGFYPEIQKATPATLANLYDLNAGSQMSRDGFSRFIEVAGWREGSLFDYKPSELFYWEHRMGTWGAIALSESDMAFRTIPGYNSRELFEAFLGLPSAIDRRSIFEAAVGALRPELGGVGYES